ncbi:MAG TPA: hypothetical protein VF244_02770 [Acidimicrobiales bacterium]
MSEPRHLYTATVRPDPAGFGQYQFSDWDPEEDPVEDLDAWAAEQGYALADSPGEQFKGLIQNESWADGWLFLIVPGDLPGDLTVDVAHPIAYQWGISP